MCGEGRTLGGTGDVVRIDTEGCGERGRGCNEGKDDG
jgi:hypothetical protein